MYTVYLIDDEPLVLLDMERSIPWAEHGLSLAGKHTDPSRALEEIAALRPDVVFTDIRMPDLTGLELIEQLRQQGLDCEFVVVSAHENFSYARQLIQLEGFDYLVKPVEEDSYTDLLDRLVKRLDQRHSHRDIPATSSDELNRIIHYLNRNLRRKHSLGEIAAQFSISSNYICFLFSKHLQTTFSAYTTKIRMEHADRLLNTTRKPIKELAVECGYEDYFYFCRVFRDYFGCTPTQRRNSVRDSHENKA